MNEDEAMSGVPELETDRLMLRPLGLSDAEQVQKAFPRWEIVKYLASRVPWPYPPDGALTFLRDHVLPAMRSGAEWHWSLRPKSSPEEIIGAISLMDEEGNNRGFWLSPEWQGQGLMSEAVETVTYFWFECLKRPVLRVPKAAANERSRRVSERTGMRLIETGERDYVSGRLPMEVWEITREEWRARGQGPNPAFPSARRRGG